MHLPVREGANKTSTRSARRLAGVMSILACIVGISMGRLLGPRAVRAESPQAALSRLVGSVDGVRERLDMLVTPTAVVYRVVDARTGAVLAEGLSGAQLAARFPHLDPSGSLAEPVLMLADDADVAIGW